MITNHRLTTAPFVATPNTSGPIDGPSLLVLHYTVSWPARAVVAGFTRKESKASAHLVLDLDGTFTQMVPFDRIAWHAGKSEWRGRGHCNGWALGIEICNPGPLFRDPVSPGTVRDVNKRVWTQTPATELAPPDGTPAHWRLWATYSPKQLDALETVCRELVREYGIREIVGHSDVSPGRKFDPGPALPIDTIRRASGLLDTDPAELAPPIAPEFDPLTLPVLRRGATGKYVILLQERLRYHTRIVTVDGVFGNGTSAAVYDFQKARGIIPDRTVGQVTWELLLNE